MSIDPHYLFFNFANRMLFFVNRILVLLTAITLSLSMLFAPSRADESAQLRSSVSKLNLWLGQGAKANSWRKYLHLNVLDSQAALGEQADVHTLRTLLSKFQQPESGLKHPMFKEVARSIENQIAALDQIHFTNLYQMQAHASNALSQFSSPTTAKVDAARKIAIYELKMLVQFYRRSLKSSERADVFFDLRLDETVEFLEKMEIELPPEVSVGKLRSMIRDQKSQQQEIQDKLDALPVEPDESDESESDERESDEPESDESDSPEEDLELEDISESILQLEPPGPDDGEDDDRELLQKQIETFDERIEELETMREKIQEKDEKRQERRDNNRRELLRAKARFRRVAQTRADSILASAKLAIDRLSDEYRFGTEDNIQEEYIRQIADFQELLPSLSDPSDSASHAKLGTIVHWLENHQQLGKLTKTIRRNFSGPNAYLSVSPSLIGSLTSQTRREYDRIAENFLGRFARFDLRSAPQRKSNPPERLI